MYLKFDVLLNIYNTKTIQDTVLIFFTTLAPCPFKAIKKRKVKVLTLQKHTALINALYITHTL